jgi:hypothetical protein
MPTEMKEITIAAESEVAERLPSDPVVQAEVLALGLRQWRIQQALDAYRRGHGSLAYAAQQAGISIREMISQAYAHGLTPDVDPAWLSDSLTLEQAAEL